MVQPHQDYDSQLWAPVSVQGDLKAQEAPLRSFIKRMRGLRDLPNWERLQTAGLSSIERQQERYQIIYIFKICKGLVPNCSVTLASNEGNTSSNPSLLMTRAAIRTLRERSLFVEGPNLFNTLPASQRSLECSLITFKANLDMWVSNIPTHPVTPGHSSLATDSNGAQSNFICN